MGLTFLMIWLYEDNSSLNTWQKGEEVEWSRQLAHLRIHIERVIGLMRNKYKIPKGVLPITLIKQPSDTTVATVNKIVTVAAALTNLSPSIVLK